MVCKTLDYIAQKAFCTRTLNRARRSLETIKDSLTEEEYNTIRNYFDNVDSDNPDVYIPEWQINMPYAKSSLYYTRGEMVKYINGLKEKYSRSK